MIRSRYFEYIGKVFSEDAWTLVFSLMHKSPSVPRTASSRTPFRYTAMQRCNPSRTRATTIVAHPNVVSTVKVGQGAFGHAIYSCVSPVGRPIGSPRAVSPGSKLAAASQPPLIHCWHRPVDVSTAASLTTHSIRRFAHTPRLLAGISENRPRTTLSSRDHRGACIMRDQNMEHTEDSMGQCSCSDRM